MTAILVVILWCPIYLLFVFLGLSGESALIGSTVGGVLSALILTSGRKKK